MYFVSRSVSNQPIVEIYGYSKEHILSSRYFRSYDYDDKCSIECEDNKVYLRVGEGRGIIGWFKEEK